MTFDLTPLNVGQVLERAIALIGKTFKRLSVVLIFLALPTALFFGVVMDSFFGTIVHLVDMAAPSGLTEESVRVILTAAGYLSVGILVVILAEIVALVCMQLIVCGEIVGRHIGTREAFELTFGYRLGRAIGQRFLAGLAIGLAIAVPYLMLPLVLAVGAGGGAIALVVVLILVAIGFALYLQVRWAFGTTTIAWEDETVMGAFTRSGYLVSGFGWRTFGLLALFAILVGVFVSVLLTPFQLLIFKDFIMASMQQARNVALQSDADVMRMFADIGSLYGIVIALSSLITTFFRSVYLPVIYFDLRARKGEFGGVEAGA